jgi:hypothetical protein
VSFLCQSGFCPKGLNRASIVTSKIAPFFERNFPQNPSPKTEHCPCLQDYQPQQRKKELKKERKII